ncbi:hypothetical protein OEB99_07975 [Actinotalea sp. M2MS4P-6]|uniref:hypothetical protein n=1 Tax=Actinotalea sp. M2MS4P-6 TaxID=2983762 RepID=UPI0021E3ED54|nr:hypothetical protein [Actinotalea sp. M2MS4P-6]MCV2394242.1 hypothetical protein [Actinotalea sp. M2MS4P-6]
MTAARYVAHVATDGGAHVSAGFVTIDADGHPLHRAELLAEELAVHGWQPHDDDESTAHALAAAAEVALAGLGYERDGEAISWYSEADPIGRWRTTTGAELRPLPEAALEGAAAV